MQRVPVVSSNLKSVGHDLLTSTLEVEFNSGDVYQYANVSKMIYDGLLAAESKGHYFYIVIKRGGYAYQKISAGAVGVSPAPALAPEMVVPTAAIPLIAPPPVPTVTPVINPSAELI